MSHVPVSPEHPVFLDSDVITTNSMPLRPVLKKNLTIQSNETGTKADIEEALKISASGKIVCEVEVMKLKDLNAALDRLQAGEVLGKLVVDLQSDLESPKSHL